MTPRRIQLAGFALILLGSILVMEISWAGLLLVVAGVGLPTDSQEEIQQRAGL